MPAKRALVPEGAPAQLWKFFKKHPGAKLSSAMRALALPESTAYYALSRLHDLGAVRRVGRWGTACWEAVKLVDAVVKDPKVVKASSPEARAVSAVAIAQIHGDAPRALVAASDPSRRAFFQPTGTPIRVVDGAARCGADPVQVIGFSGPQLKERNPSREGTVQSPGADHPWGWNNYSGSKPRGD